LFLVTNCTPPGNLVPGGSVSGNPVTPSNPSSLAQTLTLDSNPGDTIQFSFNFNNAPTTTSTAPVVTDIGIDQTAYAKMVANSSAAPTQCLHLTGELDPNTNEPLCKAFLFQCPNPTTGELSGIYCAQSTVRELLFEARFDSVEIASPYSYYTFAPGTGPAFVTGPDNWVVGASQGTDTQNDS
jgi:hypothetical protein